jgi:hypothetical protein
MADFFRAEMCECHHGVDWHDEERGEGCTFVLYIGSEQANFGRVRRAILCPCPTFTNIEKRTHTDTVAGDALKRLIAHFDSETWSVCVACGGELQGGWRGFGHASDCSLPILAKSTPLEDDAT